MRSVVKWMRALAIDSVLDVGANMGQYAVVLRACGFRERIVSFEPEPKSFEFLKQKSRRDARWEVHNLAVSVNGGEELLFVADNDSMSSSLLKPIVVDNRLYDGTLFQESISVRAISFAELLERVELAGAKTALKLDVQGLEAQLLGFVPLPDLIRLVQVEVCIRPQYENSPTLTEILAILEPQGFVLCAILPEGFMNQRTLAWADLVFIREEM